MAKKRAKAKTKTKNLSQSVTLHASPHEVYEALVNPKKHSKFTGAVAKFERKVGGEFSHYDGSLTGLVIALEPDRRVTLAWRAASWSDGHYSVADFRLTKVKGGTKLEFNQYGIPASDFDDIEDGWVQYYWEPLQVYFAE